VIDHASGTFEIQMMPQGQEEKVEGVSLSRKSADKQYSGDIEGIGKGEMVAGLTNVKTSLAYVAIERVTGTLRGRTGTFLLQHTGTMTATTRDLNVIVVPDSGTGQLAGISGKMMINIVDGKHFYEFDYTLDESHS
jgi:Flp pilus assembly protein TadG